jgi:hypothetical protein
LIHVFAAHSTDGKTLMAIAQNGLAFVKKSLERDFKISNILEQAQLTRLIIELFPDMNPQLTGFHVVGRGSLSSVPIDGLPAYE